jgi:hypothetical protein
MQSRFHVLTDEPAFYRICVLGAVDQRMTYKLGDMQADLQHSAKGEEITVLSARFQDQAALFGVLVQLYNRGYCLLGLERLDEPQPAA